MKRKFTYKFEDKSKQNILESEVPSQNGDFYVFKPDDKGNIYLFANKEGYIHLAKLFIKLAMGNFEDGFHIHRACDSRDHEIPPKGPEVIICVNQ